MTAGHPQSTTPSDHASARVSGDGGAGGADLEDAAGSKEPLLYTVEEAAQLLRVRPSWLRKKAAARAVPCTFLGKHLRFSRADLDAVITDGAQPPVRPRQRAAAVPGKRRPTG